MRPALLVLLAMAPFVPSCGGGGGAYPLHTNITATIFWVGEPQGDGSSEDNALSAWDDDWLAHYGGLDDSGLRDGATDFFPPGFVPKENPYYFDLPYNDFDARGRPRSDREQVVPWASQYITQLFQSKRTGKPFSLLKNRWAEIHFDGNVCYAQWEDSGPYVYDDAPYVFGLDDRRPRSLEAENAGMDVSPAVRDCLGFSGLNNAENRVDWRFVEGVEVPPGPWKRVVTERQVFWP